MKKEKFNELISKLDNTYKSLGGIDMSSFGIQVTNDMNIESFNQDQRFLIHSMLHLFYGKKNATLEKIDIEQLHSKVIKFIPNHKKFDRLDI